GSRDPYSAASRLGRTELIPSAITKAWGHGSLPSQGRRIENPSNLAADVLLHAVGHLDQPAPCLLQERHHAVQVAIARQRNLDLALALGDLRLRLPQRIG